MKLPLKLHAMRCPHRIAGLLAIGLLTMASNVRAADYALIIGVNSYPRLVPNADLRGCVPDAKLMDSTLKKYGFTTQLLLEEQATRLSILAALNDLAKNKNIDNFVFFFAGHGERRITDKTAVILPHDTLQSSTNNDITAEELYKGIKEVPAKSRTAILDSCFAGAMLRDKGLGRGSVRYRYHDRSKDLVLRETAVPVDVDPNDADTTNYLTMGQTQAAVCYFAAAKENERATEDFVGGEHHGLFTYHLAQLFAQNLPNKQKWDAVKAAVAAKVADDTLERQHPVLSQGFEQFVMFSPFDKAAPAPAAPKTKLTYWELLHSGKVDATQVRLRMEPGMTRVKVGQPLSFSAEVQGSGYLIVLEKGTSGKYNLLYPQRGMNVDDAFMKPGELKRVPNKGWHFEPDDVGTEHIRAMLLTSRAMADEIIGTFRDAGSRSLTRGQFKDGPNGLSSKDLRMVADDVPQETYSATLTFEVVKE